MKHIIKVFAVIVLVFSSQNSYAVAAWYKGTLERVALVGDEGSFIVVFESDVLSGCKWNYSYFMVSRLGLEKVKSAYSMALAALSSGKKFGTVIDKDLNGEGQPCYAQGMTADISAN